MTNYKGKAGADIYGGGRGCYSVVYEAGAIDKKVSVLGGLSKRLGMGSGQKKGRY